MTRLLVALTIAVLLSCFEFGWRVELPPMPRLIPQLHAQAAQGDTECILWADIKPWAITRCESWETNEICFIASSGMMACKWGEE